MNTFDVLADSDVKDQMEKLHKAVTDYISHVRETIEDAEAAESTDNKKDKGIEVDKILVTLGDIKANLIEALMSKKASNYALHALNVVYNFDAFLNPIATTVVTYAIRQLYVNKIGLEIISNINNVIKCVCMDMIARSKANRGLAEVSNLSKDYGMKISEVISVTQKYVDSRDTQVMHMLDQTIQHDAEGFKENIESADKLIDAFAANDKWVAEWGTTCRAITIQSANNLCLKVRKDMGSYITALSTCLDRHVVENLRFNDRGDYYDEHAIDREISSNERKLNIGYREADKAADNKQELIDLGKKLNTEKKIRSYKEYKNLEEEEQEALNAYWTSEPNKAPQAMRFVYDKRRLYIALKRVNDAIVPQKLPNNEHDIMIGTDFYMFFGLEDFRLYVYDIMDFKFSDHVEMFIKNKYNLLQKDRRIGKQPDRAAKLEILSKKNLFIQYINALRDEHKFNTAK